MRGAQPICPNVRMRTAGQNAEVRNLRRSVFDHRPPWGDGGSRKRQCRGDTRTVCTPPAGCGKQSRNRARPAGNAHCPNSAKKFNIPVRAINGKNSKSVRQRLFCACKTKNERGDLSLSHAWYGGRIPGNTGYMGALACVGSTPAAPTFPFVRVRIYLQKRKAGVKPRLSLLARAGRCAAHQQARTDF